MYVLRFLILFASFFLYGREINQSYDFQSIKEFRFSGAGIIEIKQGEANHLEISAPPSLLEHIFISADNKILTIESNGSDKLSAQLTSKDLEKIVLKGNVQVDIDKLIGEHLILEVGQTGTAIVEGTLDLNRLIVSLYGNSTADLRGKVGEQAVFIEDSATYVANKLKTTNTLVRNSGTGNAYIWATDQLNTSLLGDGSIQYIGTPKHIYPPINGNNNILPYIEGTIK
ncbi:MAG: DUF2807 domain-containing protein [Chlamydiia bacterium]|nr:DUF2807 domain-containing protein [Chlamydiia bacterium]